MRARTRADKTYTTQTHTFIWSLQIEDFPFRKKCVNLPLLVVGCWCIYSSNHFGRKISGLNGVYDVRENLNAFWVYSMFHWFDLIYSWNSFCLIASIKFVAWKSLAKAEVRRYHVSYLSRAINIRGKKNKDRSRCTIHNNVHLWRIFMVKKHSGNK